MDIDDRIATVKSLIAKREEIDAELAAFVRRRNSAQAASEVQSLRRGRAQGKHLPR
jgi:hypothetical protein